MRFYLTLTTALALTILALSQVAPAASVNDFTDYSFVENNVTLLPGRLHVPAGVAAEPNTLRPLILFLHGAGESGTNNLAQINGNIDNLLAAAKARDAFLYAPQTNSGWTSSTLLSHAMTMIDRAIADQHVDPNRIYLTGLSMGGGGAWNFMNQFPDRVAATVPIAAVSPTASFSPAKVIDEPIWAFHGRFDSTVSTNVTRSVINSLLTEAGQPIPTYPPLNTFGPHVQFDFPPLDLHYTDMRGSHGIWPEVYNTPALYDWMFAHGAVPEPCNFVLLFLGLAGSTLGRFRIGGHTPQLQLRSSVVQNLNVNLQR